MRGSRIAVAVLGASFLALAACGNDASVADPGDNARCLPDAADCDDTPPAAGMCLEGATDCVDTVEGGSDAFDEDAEREAAEGMIGLTEAELAPDVRIGRRGAEQFALTEDYVLGRKTVELDADADGVFRVTSVTVELLDGPDTFS